jgi:hypothetical protein
MAEPNKDAMKPKIISDNFGARDPKLFQSNSKIAIQNYSIFIWSLVALQELCGLGFSIIIYMKYRISAQGVGGLF